MNTYGRVLPRAVVGGEPRRIVLLIFLVQNW